MTSLSSPRKTIPSEPLSLSQSTVLKDSPPPRNENRKVPPLRLQTNSNDITSELQKSSRILVKFPKKIVQKDLPTFSPRVPNTPTGSTEDRLSQRIKKKTDRVRKRTKVKSLCNVSEHDKSKTNVELGDQQRALKSKNSIRNTVKEVFTKSQSDKDRTQNNDSPRQFIRRSNHKDDKDIYKIKKTDQRRFSSPIPVIMMDSTNT